MWRCLLLVLALLSCAAAARQDPAPLRQAIEDYLFVQTKGLPGKVAFSVGHIDPSNNLAPCPAFDVSLPRGGRLWGRGSVVVRCQADAGWKLYVPVQVRVSGEYLVAGRPLAQGQIVAEADLVRQSGDLTDLPGGVLTEADEAIGRTAAMSIPAGRPLRADMLRLPLAIQQGQGVKVLSKGPGFQVTAEGRALNNAAAGQVAQVRLSSGQVVSGIARPGGIVEVGY